MAETAQSTSSSDVIDIKVKTMQPATYELSVPPGITVAELKQQLRDKTNIPVERQRIIYQGRALENGQQLQSYGVQQGHSLHLVERAPPAPPPAAVSAEASSQAAGPQPIAFGSLELDAGDENDVNGMLNNIFRQLGGHNMPGFMAGGDGNASEEELQRQGQEAQMITQQLMDSLALGAGHDPGAGQGNREGMRHHVLLSIAAYMRRLETTVDNPPILLPSLSYPSAQGDELQQQTQMMDAVRSIVRRYMGHFNDTARAYLDSEGVFQPPRPAPRQQRDASAAAPSEGNASAQASAAAPTGSAAEPAASTSATAEPALQTPEQPAPTTATVAPAPASTANAAPPVASTNTSTQTQEQGTAAPAQNQAADSSAQRRSSQHSAQSGGEPAQGGRNASDGGRRQRRRPPAISPSVTVALGTLLHEMIIGDTFEDAHHVLSRTAAALRRIHSYEGAQLQEALTSLRQAGSHLYRLAPLMMELARVFSAAVAALQGDAGPLALSGSQYIRSDGSRPIIGHNPGNVQHSISMATIPFFPGMGMMGPDGHMPPGHPPGTAASGGRAAHNGPAPSAAGDGAAARSGNQPGAPAGAAAAHGTGQGTGRVLPPFAQMLMGGGQHHMQLPGQHPLGAVAVAGEARQVIQVPGAPPVSIRWGQLGNAAQATASQGAQANNAVSLQFGDGVPIDLAPVIQSLRSTLRSAVQSAFSSRAGTPSAAASAGNPPAPSAAQQAATTAPASAAASASAGAPTSHSNASGNGTSATTASPAIAAQSASLDAHHMHQIVRALLVSLVPSISAQSGPRSASRGAGSAAAPNPTVPSAPRARGPQQGVLSDPSLPQATAATLSGQPTAPAAAAATSATSASTGAPCQPSMGTTIHPSSSEQPHATTQTAASAVQANQHLPSAASDSVPHSASGPSGSAAPEDSSRGKTSALRTTAVASEHSPAAATTASGPLQASASGSGDVSGQDGSKGKRPALPARAAGLGSAGLPPRKKIDKAPQKTSTKTAVDKGETSSKQASSSRPAPSQPEQDNVKRARVGDTPSDAAPSHQPGTSQQGVEEITWPAQRPASNQDGDSLAALMSNLGGGRTDNNSGLSSRQGASAGGGLGGLMQIANQFMSDPEVSQAVSGMIENVGRDSMARAGQRSGQAASGPAPEGLGGLIQGLAPMMQQLMSGGSGQNSSQGASSGHHAVQGRPSQNWQDALKELDEEERADWEQTIREDLVKQADMGPQGGWDHSQAYLAGNPPASNSMFAAGDSSAP